MSKNNSIGLSMIVKNEAHVIDRVLNSVAPLIDYWVIVDTGSTDGTQQKIQDFFSKVGIPGEIVNFTWIDDFSAARNIALEKIEPHVDYGIWIDADEELIIDPSFCREDLFKSNPDSCLLKTIYGKLEYVRKNIWKTGAGFNWLAPVHESLETQNEGAGVTTDKLSIVVRREGNSWLGDIKEKYSKHAEILSAYTEINTNPRWVFYTAQSYRDAQNYTKAIEWYMKRAAMLDGCNEEVYISKLSAAKLSEITNEPKEKVISLYTDAHTSDPIRGEALRNLVRYYHKVEEWEMAYIMSKYGLRYVGRNPYPNRMMLIETEVYTWVMLELHALSCFYSGRHAEGTRTYWQLREMIDTLSEDEILPEQREKIHTNSKFFPREVATLPI